MVRRSGMSRRSFLRSAGIGAAGLGAAAMGMSGVASAAKPLPGGILDQLWNHQGRKLRVAIDGDGKPGFFENGEGLEADLARAIAFAIWGPSTSDDRIEWVPVDSASRFFKVVNGEADVCFRSCTWTGSRDAYQEMVGSYYVNAGVAFAPVYFYDGLDVLVNANKAPQGTSISNMSIGVQYPSTTHTVLSEELGLSNLVTYTGPTAKSDRNAAFAAGHIDAMAGDSSDVGAYSSATTYLYFTYTTGQPYGKEPLAPFVAEGDNNWHDIVSWVMFAMFEAYELDYLGKKQPGDWGWDIGDALGLNKMWAKWAVTNGHYGDLFETHLGVPPTGKNKLWLENGLIYSMAFR